MLTMNSSSKQLTCFVSIWFNLLYVYQVSIYVIWNIDTAVWHNVEMLTRWPGYKTNAPLWSKKPAQSNGNITQGNIFLHSVISCGVIKYVELFKIKVIEVIMINSATKRLCSPSSWLISQLSTTEDLLSCQVFEYFRLSHAEIKNS